MNLNKQQQQAYARLTDALGVMTDVTDDPVIIREKMQPRIAKFIEEAGGEIKVKLVGDGVPSIELIDLSKDSMKTTLDSTQTLNLRARFESVLVSVTAAYKDVYAHNNEAIADALLGLSEKVRGLPFEIVTQGACNIDELLGLSHRNANDVDDESDAGGDTAGVSGLPVGALAVNAAPGLNVATVGITHPDADGSKDKPAADAAETGDAPLEQAPSEDAVIELVAAVGDTDAEAQA